MYVSHLMEGWLDCAQMVFVGEHQGRIPVCGPWIRSRSRDSPVDAQVTMLPLCRSSSCWGPVMRRSEGYCGARTLVSKRWALQLGTLAEAFKDLTYKMAWTGDLWR